MYVGIPGKRNTYIEMVDSSAVRTHKLDNSNYVVLVNECYIVKFSDEFKAETFTKLLLGCFDFGMEKFESDCSENLFK